MQSKSKNKNEITRGGNHPYNVSSTPVCGEPWWKTAGYNSAMRAGGSNSSSMEPSVESDGGFDEEDEEATKDSADLSSEGNYQQGHHAASNFPPTNDESITQTPQLKLVSHSIACASNPYCDPYYGGLMAAYGQPLVYPPHLLDMHHHHPRVALPVEMAPEPVYVNAKQYNGILRRRQSRAKAELEKKLIKDRKPYLHESRHQHAMRRARASGGRFAKKSKSGDDSSKNTSQENTNNERCENNSNNASSSSAYGGERGDQQQQQQWGSAQRAVAMQ